jgi:hypothetical protein
VCFSRFRSAHEPEQGGTPPRIHQSQPFLWSTAFCTESRPQGFRARHCGQPMHPCREATTAAVSCCCRIEGSACGRGQLHQLIIGLVAYSTLGSWICGQQALARRRNRCWGPCTVGVGEWYPWPLALWPARTRAAAKSLFGAVHCGGRHSRGPLLRPQSPLPPILSSQLPSLR